MTVRLTVAQALVRFLARQYSERDGVRQRLIPACFGIFGHGNVAGVGQALLQAHQTGEADLEYYLARNEQAMVHASVGFARMRNRLQALACTASIGPGSTNMVTGAALATIARIPVLLLPSDSFATRAASPVLQELEDPRSYDVSVNDAFRPVSRFWDRINRPEQLPSALLAAMRVLTDPAETGAVTLALPQDVQAEAHDWPEDLFTERTWYVPRPLPEPAALARAVAVLTGARRPLVIAGGGVIYSQASAALRQFAEATGMPVSDTQAGKGALAWDHPCAVGGVGATGSAAANALAADADVVLGLGTRYSDFTTASRTAFGHPGVRFVNLNVTAFDAGKHAGVALVADARAGLEALMPAMAGHRVAEAYTSRIAELNAGWRQTVDHAYHLGHQPLPAQTEILGALNEFIAERDVVVQAAGSMPGDLQMLWRARDPKQYHVEYGYSCMGYEIAGGLGAKLADPGREVFVLVGDGSYLMMASEIVTAVSEGIKLTIVLVDNRGFGSIGSLSESLGSQRFGTRYRYRDPATGMLDGGLLPVDLAANAASLGADVLRTRTVKEFVAALEQARASRATTVVYIETDPLAPVPSSQSWWDVPVSEVSALESTQQARAAYEAAKRDQRPYLLSERLKLRMRTIQHWIAGSETTGASTRFGPVWNPATGTQQAQVALATPADVEAAVAAAAKAFAEWRNVSLVRRARVMFALRDLIERHLDELSGIIADEHGKVLSDARGEVIRGLEVVEFAAGIPTLLKGEYSEQVSTDVDAYSFRQPLGVCAGITPFNFPAMVPMWMHPIAIATGNTFVLKPSERDPSLSVAMARLYAEAGLPDGVFNVVHGDKVAVDAILDHPGVAAVSFVGSTPIARYVHQRTSAAGKRVQALGGAKNHAVVLPDADIEFAANQITAAGYGSAGQRCMAISAVVAVGDAGDALVARLGEKAGQVRVGPGRDQASEMGPVITAQARDRIAGYVGRGEQAGATLVADGRGRQIAGHPGGFFVGPTLFDHVTTDMDIYRDEIFGPVLVVVRAATYREALDIVNANPYGNGTAIFTSSGRAARDFQRHVQVGMIGINVPIPVPMAFYSFGGWKDSLFGDTHVHGTEGIRFYTHAKAITSRWPDSADQTQHRAQLQFPTAT